MELPLGGFEHAVGPVKTAALLLLSLAAFFRKEAFPQVELPLEMALGYLRSEALILPNQPMGNLLMTYQGVPLGFVKNVGNRSNNLYPNEWRIRKK